MKCLKCQKTIEFGGLYGLHANCFVEWFELTESLEFNSLDPKKTISYSSDIKNIKDSFYHGRYRKYSAQLGGQQYILKVQETKYPELSAVEYLCNKIASLLNINVPKYYLIKYQEKNQQKIVHAQSTDVKNNIPKEKHQSRLMTFVTRNFMQDYVGTLNHIYKYLPKGDKNYNCQNIIKVIDEQTGRLNNIETFVEICLFDSFIGNNDRHGRNLGMIDTGKQKFLAPMYDNPSYIGMEKSELLDADLNPSGCIWTSASEKPKPLDYIREFKKLKLEKPCYKFIKNMIDKFPVVVEEIKNSIISERRKKAFVNLLTNRFKDYKQTIEEDFKNV